MAKQMLALNRILSEVREGSIQSQFQLNKVKIRAARKFGLKQLPTNAEIIAEASEEDRRAFQRILSRKPVRSISGVTVVAVMTKPYGCVAKCIYCPSSLVPGKETPKSYTGFEPSTRRGMMFNFNPYRIVENRLKQYREINNFSPKIELILQGGTFTALPFSHQKYFVKRCFDAVLGKTTSSLSEAKSLAEHSQNRVVGLTIETRPDWCKEKEINRMLSYGVTRVELGVQNPDNEIYRRSNRGHTVEDVVESTQLLKDSSLKVLYHLMPGLPGSTPEADLRNFRKVFSEQEFLPDMVKIYPCLVIDGTPLHRLWEKGLFEPLSTEKAAKLVARLKEFIPRYVRVMRIQRDIPSNLVAGGVKKTNLRQLVEKELEAKGIKCNCIRCREIGFKNLKHSEVEGLAPELLREDYNASKGSEVFLSFEDKKSNALFGFCRLRIPFKPFRKEITPKTALLRELHVYSKALELSLKPSNGEFQHRGFGQKLVLEAERIAREEFDCNKIVVIAGIGVKQYYREKIGYANEGVYVSKSLQ